MKKGKLLLIYCIFFIISLFKFISAQYYGDIRYQLESAAMQISPFVSFFLGGAQTGELLLIKFLVFILLLTLINYSLRRVPMFEDNLTITGLVSIIVTLLGVRFITTDTLVQFIWLPYGGLGVLLVSLFPFIIFFYFIESFDVGLIRKVGWTSFLIIYGMLAYFRWNDLKFGPAFWQNFAWIYFMVAFVSLIILLFERGLRQRLLLGMMREGTDANTIVLRTDLQKRINKLNEALSNPDITRSDASKLKKERVKLERALKRTY